MNYFKKKDRVLVSLSDDDFEHGPGALRKDLVDILPYLDAETVRFTISSTGDIPLNSLGVLMRVFQKLKKEGRTLVLKSRGEIVEDLRKTGLTSFFDDIIAEDG